MGAATLSSSNKAHVDGQMLMRKSPYSIFLFRPAPPCSSSRIAGAGRRGGIRTNQPPFLNRCLSQSVIISSMKGQSGCSWKEHGCGENRGRICGGKHHVHERGKQWAESNRHGCEFFQTITGPECNADDGSWTFNRRARGKAWSLSRVIRCRVWSARDTGPEDPALPTDFVRTKDVD
jgi:hypothetical protein